MDLHLLPTPTRCDALGGTRTLPTVLTVTGASPALLATTLGGRGRVAGAPEAVVHAATDLAGPAQGYQLTLPASGPITVRASDEAGLRSALVTLAQLAATPGPIPAVTITDAPAFAVRGAMLDISRDRVPTMAFLHELVARLASWKINHLQLYTEHTFAYRGHEAVWGASSPMTAEEMRTLDRLCAAHGIALTANQNCLGHVERWLKVPSYAHLGERVAGQMAFGNWYVDPNTFIPGHPEVLALVRSWLDELIPTCSGAYVNIGCDEPFDLGTGRSRERVAQEGLHQVYAAHVSAVAGMVRAHGRRPLYWADPDHVKPDMAAALPADIVPLVWNYRADAPFAKACAPFRERGLETWVAPGTNCWTSFTGRTTERRANCGRAAIEGRQVGATGFLMTAWGDGGHRQQIPLTLAGLADGAQASWTGSDRFDDLALGRHGFGCDALGGWLMTLGDVDRPARQAGGGVFADCGLTLFDPHQPGAREAYAHAAAGYAALAASLPAPDGLVRQECAHACAMAQWAADRAVLRRSHPTLEARQALAARLAELLAEHRQLWLARSRVGGLEQSCDRYRVLLAHY